jgi:AraC-like DNA-binding protein
MRPATVSREYMQAVLLHLDSFGISRQQLLDAPELRHLAAQPDSAAGTRMPLHEWRALLGRAMALTGDAELPLRLASVLRPYHFGLLGYLIMTGDTLGDVARSLEQYEQLLDGLNEARLVLHGNTVDIEWIPLIENPEPMFSQMSMTTWAVVARFLTNRPDLQARAYFSFPAPANIDIYQSIFGLPAVFNQNVSRIEFAADYMTLPVVQRNPRMHELLRDQADAQLEQLIPNASLLRSLEERLLSAPADARPDLPQLAEAVGLSARSLQYRLEDMGLSYRALLDNVRRRQAERLLRDPRQTLHDIALSLGFADQSAFQRAFKRWCGQSPGEYRRAHRA